ANRPARTPKGPNHLGRLRDNHFSPDAVHHGSRRPLAWRGVDLRGFWIPARRLSFGLPRMASIAPPVGDRLSKPLPSRRAGRKSLDLSWRHSLPRILPVKINPGGASLVEKHDGPLRDRWARASGGRCASWPFPPGPVRGGLAVAQLPGNSLRV